MTRRPDPTDGGEPWARKPTARELGINLEAQAWQRSGDGDGAIEIAFVPAASGVVAAALDGTAERGPRGEAGRGPADATAVTWVLMRVVGDPDGRVLLYDRHEWECFLDGARGGEFDDAGR